MITELLAEAIEQLRQLPEPVQDAVARSVILQLDEELERSALSPASRSER